jgi:hypothetical protein
MPRRPKYVTAKISSGCETQDTTQPRALDAVSQAGIFTCRCEANVDEVDAVIFHQCVHRVGYVA